MEHGVLDPLRSFDVYGGRLLGVDSQVRDGWDAFGFEESLELSISTRDRIEVPFSDQDTTKTTSMVKGSVHS